MNYYVKIDDDVCPVIELLSYHISDDLCACFQDVVDGVSPDRTMIKFELPDGRVGVIPVALDIKNVVHHFEAISAWGQPHRADEYYVCKASRPKPDLHALFGINLN